MYHQVYYAYKSATTGVLSLVFYTNYRHTLSMLTYQLICLQSLWNLFKFQRFTYVIVGIT